MTAVGGPNSIPDKYAAAQAPDLQPPVSQHTSQAQRRTLSPLAHRPHSVEELAKIAEIGEYDCTGSIKQDLRLAEVYRAEGNKDLQADELEWAFVHFSRTATLVLQKTPTNDHYHDMKEAHRSMLADVSSYLSYSISCAVRLTLIGTLFSLSP